MRLRARTLASWPLQLANLAVIGASAGAFLWLLGRLPDLVPVQWALGPEQGEWASPQELWGFGGVQVFTTLVLWGAATAVARRSLPEPPAVSEGWLVLETRRRGLVTRGLEVFTLGFNLAVGGVWLAIAASLRAGGGDLVPLAIGALLVAMVATLALVAVVCIRPLIRVMTALDRVPGGPPRPARPENWRLGGIYYAPDDPSVIVPRGPEGRSAVNFARPVAWLVIGLLFLLPLLMVLALTLQVR